MADGELPDQDAIGHRDEVRYGTRTPELGAAKVSTADAISAASCTPALVTVIPREVEAVLAARRIATLAAVCAVTALSRASRWVQFL